MGTTNLQDHLLDQKEIDALVKNYDEKNYSAINARRILPDSKEYTFPIELLEEYLKLVKDKARDNSYTNLRICIKMGQYPEDRVMRPSVQKPNTEGYQTICLTAVYDKSSTSGDASKGASADGIPGMNFGTIFPPF